MWVAGQRRQQALVAARVQAIVAAHAAGVTAADPDGVLTAGSWGSDPVGGEHDEVDDGLFALSDAELAAVFDAGVPASVTSSRSSQAASSAEPMLWRFAPTATDSPSPAPSSAGTVPGDGTRPPALPPGPAPTRPAWLDRLVGARPVHAHPARRPVVAVGLAALLAAVITGWWVFSSQPQAVPAMASGTGRVRGSAAAVASPTATPGAASGSWAGGATVPVVVDVEGRVRRPGLYRLPAGARVADALAAAGGARPHTSTTSLNLAARLTDGQQIVVGGPVVAGSAPAPAPGSGAASGTSGAGAPVSLNAATLDQLQTLPGVGPVLAQHILDWRAEHGGFTAIDQLDDVTGIGDVKFAQLKALVTL